MFEHDVVDQDCITVELVDFLSSYSSTRNYNGESYQVDPLIGMLKQKFRSPKMIAFSNEFEEIKIIEQSCEVYDVRISRSCSLFIVITSDSFLFMDYETLEVKGKMATDSCYFELEEDYDNCGNDALVIYHDRDVSKYDLKQFISEKENCKPLWTYSNDSGSDTSEPINVMILDGKRVVVFNFNSCMNFLDSRTGKILPDYTLKLDGAISGCFEPDRKNSNTLYLFMKEMKRYEYENGNWKCTSFPINLRSIDGLCMDRTSGLIYFSGYSGSGTISAYTTSGTHVATQNIDCSGICIDHRTGLMYLGVHHGISVLK